MDVAPYGSMPDGRNVRAFTLTNAVGMRVRLMEYGATTMSIELPDAAGRLTDVTLGFDTLEGWLSNNAFIGNTVGRCANRIANGRFSIDGRSYQLTTNDGLNHLHGGHRGFFNVLWSGRTVTSCEGAGVEFTYNSPDGEEGYPGNLIAKATYTLTPDNRFIAEFNATTDAPTIVNMVHHSYWNLSGAAAGGILDHRLMIPADRYTPVDQSLVPTGELRSVTGTPFDFQKPIPIGKNIANTPAGYDHNFVLADRPGPMALSARLADPAGGRSLEIYADQPGIQFYSGNYFDGSIVGKGGVRYEKHHGLCLETQRFPDSPNHPHFPSVILRPGEQYHHRMVHIFKTDPAIEA